MEKLKFKNILGKNPLFFDGATDTMLQTAGLKKGEMPELWNFEKPEAIKKIHKAYLEAGADIIESNTFGSHPAKIGKTPHSTYDIVYKGVTLAVESINEFISQTKMKRRFIPFVAASLGPSGHLLKPLGPISFDEAYEGFTLQVKAALDGGADLIFLETMTDTYELKAAVLAAKENSSLPIIVSCMIDEKGCLHTGGNVASIVSLVEGLGVDGIGLNCDFGLDKLIPFALDLISQSSLPILLNSNACLSEEKKGETTRPLSPSSFSKEVCSIAKYGFHLIRGCCGTGPDHIKKLISTYKKASIPFISPQKKTKTVISSCSKTVEIGKLPIIVGEKINPGGNKTLKTAVKSKDMNYVSFLAKKQAELCPVLDVNMGLSGLNKTELLKESVIKIQEAVDIPLMIDTVNPTAMEQALRYYNGKACINSVSGKKSSMDKIFPLAKKYGGLVIALTLDDSGIPETAVQRVRIAEKIVEEGSKYGLEKKDFIVDPLTLTVISDPASPNVTLEALRILTKKGFKTSIGVSNISFGLPSRDSITATFFSLALKEGLSCGIANPFSHSLISSYYSTLALINKDKNCTNYIDFFKANPSDNAPICNS